MFARKGYRASRLEDIAEELGVTKPALYYYIKNKHQILLLIFEEIMSIYLSSAMTIIEKDMDPKEKFRSLIERHAESVLNNQSFTTIFNHEQSELNEEEKNELRKKVQKYEILFENVYRDGVNKGIFKSIDPHLVIAAIFGMVNSLYHSYEKGNSPSKKAVIEIYLQILEGGYACHIKKR